MQNRFETHCHFEWSNIRFLDAINKLEPTVNYAIEIGLKGLCITDHGCICGWMKANILQKQLKEKGIDFKIGLGEEGYLVDKRENGIKYYHCIWLAKDEIGAKQIRRISSLAWMNSYYDRGIERVCITKEELANIVKENPGHIIVTTACIGGEVSSSILAMETARKLQDTETATINKKKIIDFILWAKDLFKDDFFLEVAPAANKEQIIVNKKMVELSKVFDVKMILGSDAHYLKKQDRYIHEAFLNSKGAERETAQFYEYAYLQTEDEIKQNLTPSIIDSYEEMCKNSMEIYDKIEWYDLTHPQVIPSVEVKNYPKEEKNVEWDGFDKKYPILTSMHYSDDKYERYWVNECLNQLTFKGLYKDEYLSRLEEEADIKKTIGEKLGTNMFSYPITLAHYVDMFWECGSIVGAGRGSSCSGLNHYLLGVTQLDPLKWNFPFWRYLNKERVELGDIDLDLCPSKRPIIIQKIKEERGKNFKPEIDEISRKNLGCTMVATYGTETTKSTILTSCRGYRSEDYPSGIDVDTAQYLSSLIPQERGFLWTLKEVVYGNPEKDRKPVTTFINEVNNYPGLLDIMLGIEGLISRRGIHASGVILFDEDPYEFGCFMKAPNGEITTQYDLHMAEAAGMTKYDFLLTEVQDKIAQCIKFLQENGEIEKDLTLREVYNKYFHPDVLDIEDEATWKNIQEGKILNIFQFDSDVGSQAAKKIAPKNMVELSDANGLMRLMTAEKGAETPMDKYIRYKNNIKLWYDEMKAAHLNEDEIKAVEPYFKSSYGVPPSQEQLMMMLMDEDICGFSLKDANAARKIVGKKQMSKIPELKEKIMNQAASAMLGKYIWECGVGPQMGYSFSVIHATAYSFIGYQTAYLATRWNPIYWDTACLVVNSGSLEEDNDYDEEDGEVIKKKEKGADYAKIAKAIGEITSHGIEVSLVNINTSDYGFEPDIANNRILYGLKALSNINTEMIEKIKSGRPYSGIKDFMVRCPLTKVPMVMLIKGGAFDEVETKLNNRKEIMAYYISKISEPKTRLTLQNFNGLILHGLVPKEYELQIRVYNFTKYLKKNLKYKEYFKLDETSISFLEKFMPEVMERTIVEDNNILLQQSYWDSIYQSNMDIVRDWLNENKEVVLRKYNDMLFMESWEKYAAGTPSAWEMDALCFYHGPHELINVDMKKYNISDFNQLQSEEIDYFFKRNNNQIPIYKLYRIAGTVLNKNDARHSVSLLTTTGVVNVKFTGEYYAMFKKQISEIQPDGSKKVKEKSWFKRGTKLLITGFRRDNQFVGKTYARTIGHQLYKITDIVGDEIKLQHERYTSSTTTEEDEYDEM